MSPPCRSDCIEWPARASIGDMMRAKIHLVAAVGLVAFGLGLGDASDARAQSAPAKDTGYLTVSSIPPAHLLLDGTDTGKVTPIARFEVKSGRHKVTLQTDMTSRSFGIVVVAGEETKLNVNL